MIVILFAGVWIFVLSWFWACQPRANSALLRASAAHDVEPHSIRSLLGGFRSVGCVFILRQNHLASTALWGAARVSPRRGFINPVRDRTTRPDGLDSPAPRFFVFRRYQRSLANAEAVLALPMPSYRHQLFRRLAL